MKNYMEYLEKLQGKMSLDEVVDKNKVVEYRESYDKYNGLSSMFGFIGIAVVLSSIFVSPYSKIGAVAVMLVAFGFVCLVIKFSNKAEHYEELFRNERDKVYNVNYSVIKNAIIDGGDEHMQQLVTWEYMCELTVDDKEKYAELLRIVHDVCREYAILWGN